MERGLLKLGLIRNTAENEAQNDTKGCDTVVG
jgi:hypothetical protein